MRSILEAPGPIERATARLPLGRAPLQAFVVDGETERVLRDCLTQLAIANATISRGGIARAIDTLGSAALARHPDRRHQRRRSAGIASAHARRSVRARRQRDRDRQPQRNRPLSRSAAGRGQRLHRQAADPATRHAGIDRWQPYARGRRDPPEARHRGRPRRRAGRCRHDDIGGQPRPGISPIGRTGGSRSSISTCRTAIARWPSTSRRPPGCARPSSTRCASTTPCSNA